MNSLEIRRDEVKDTNERRSKRGLAIKIRFRHSEGNDCFFWGGVSSRTGSQQTKASAARIAPILIPKGWKNAAAYPMRCGTKPRSTLLRQASAGGDFGPRGDKRRNGFPNDGVSRLDPAVRKKSGSIPAPRRIPRWTAAPTLRSAAPDRAAEATCQYSSVTDRENRMGRAAASPNLKLLLEKETRRCRRL
mgnify:CR=1 FL=1